MAYSGNSGGFGASGGYQGVRQFEGATNTAPVVRDTGATPSSAPVKPAFKSKGMQLGKKSKTANLFGAEAEDEEPLPVQAAAPVSRAAPAAAAAAASSTATASATTRPSSKTVDPIDLLPPVTQEGVHLVVKERISLQATRDGSLESLEVKGDLELRITDPTLSKVAVQVTPASTSSLLPASALQFKTHPHVDKAAWADGRLIKLRDANKPFPVRQNLGVLRWRATTKDETVVPLSVQCWPSPAEDGSGACDVMIEFELENKALQLQNVVIAVPLPPGVEAQIGEDPEHGTVDVGDGTIEWHIEAISEEAGVTSGQLEIKVNEGAADPDVFFPVSVDFVSPDKTLGDIVVDKVSLAGSAAPVTFSTQSVLSADGYYIN